RSVRGGKLPRRGRARRAGDGDGAARGPGSGPPERPLSEQPAPPRHGGGAGPGTAPRPLRGHRRGGRLPPPPPRPRAAHPLLAPLTLSAAVHITKDLRRARVLAGLDAAGDEVVPSVSEATVG